MRVRLLVPLLASAALLAPAAGASASAPAAVKVRSCRSGETAKHRRAAFHARMRAVPGTARMKMRFTLIDRSGSRAASPLSVAPLERWRKSRRGVTRFGYTQRITGLRPGAAYAVTVDFRWLDAGGHTIHRLRRTSADCREDGALPNLRVTGVSAEPGDAAGTELYLVEVTNSGTGEADGVQLDLFVDSAATDAAEIDVIDPGETVTKKISGPACSLEIRAVVDRLDEIPESDEADNTFRSGCPRPAG